MNMKSQALLDSSSTTPNQETKLYKAILIALDSSDHANAAMEFAIALAGLTADAQITGIHAYAAKLHDVRFRQMEGGLPEQFREEQELERQRDVHDDLITRGLSIITDCYLDQADNSARKAGMHFNRCSLEGKNYRALTEETNSGHYDLLVMGALGLGAVEGSRLGTVCQRVTRRSDIDTLVIKQPKRVLSEGPIVVAVDGSSRSYGGLLTALQLAKHWQVPVKVIAVFDPYFHYVAFNRIAEVLSEEADKVFRFKEQERLHEEIIDSGLAKIYQGHLDVAQSIAKDHDIEIETVLLDGKPHDAISKYIYRVNPSLLVVGKLGIHADDELDIGGNAENVLNDVACAVLLSQREHTPRLDVVADITTSWTHEAERAMDKVPGFARNMARMAILRHAQERGHTVITEKIVNEATATLCPSHARKAMAEIVAAHDAGEINAGHKGFNELDWSADAETLLNQTEDSSIRNNLRKRAEKKARSEGSSQVEKEHIESFIAVSALGTNDKAADPDPTILHPSSLAPDDSLHWQTAALARLMRVPEGFMRDSSRQHIEVYAQQQGFTEITLEVAEMGLQKEQESMTQGMQQSAGTCPFGHNKKKEAEVEGMRSESTNSRKDTINHLPTSTVIDSDLISSNDASTLSWSSEALARLEQVPAGMSRDMTHKAVEAIAQKQGIHHIEQTFLENVLNTFQSGSANTNETLPWETTARALIQRAPDMIRGMLIKEIESWVRRNNLEQVTETAVQTVKTEWQRKGYFHLSPNDPRSGKE